MERCLTELEHRPQDSELLGDIFRTVHTIKGTTGFLGFWRLERLAHVGESLLGSLRDGQLTANTTIISGLLQLLDGLRAILLLVEQTGTEGVRANDHDADLIAVLERLNGTAPAETSADSVAVPNDLDQPVSKISSPRPETSDLPATPSGAPGGMNEKTLRIDVEVLNRMMNLIGELVLTRNQILQTQVDAANFPQLARRLDCVTADLRETVMQARMQPVGHLFGKFPRMVRDLARSCNKQVRMEFAGETTGLDKSLLEAIKDPLTHAVRNAVDHGIEPVEKRAAAGKPLEGLVRLTAFHQNGSVVIEIADDGGGIPQQRVLAKAIERRLITPERAARMTPREILQLIFLPGFSTAKELTKVSGRGVGMDVVRANVEGVNGTVEVDSREGYGTTLRLRVPLTLAIVPALVVRSGGQSFCLPQGSLAELVYVPQREAATLIEHMGEAELLRLREELLPIVWLERLLELAPASEQRHGFYVAVLDAEGCRYGLVVDDLMAPEEIVVKPLSLVLREIGLFSGATVLGNGTLAMILDVAATTARARIKAVIENTLVQASTSAALDAEGKPRNAATAKEPSFLVYEDGTERGQLSRERRALPLETVERIESVRAGDVERVGGRLVLQYRGELLPLDDRGGVLARALQQGPETVVTVLICERSAMQRAGFGGIKAQDVAGEAHTIRPRLGLVVEQVLDVATGALLERTEDVCGDPIARVKDRLAVLHSGFLRGFVETPAVLAQNQNLLAEVA